MGIHALTFLSFFFYSLCVYLYLHSSLSGVEGDDDVYVTMSPFDPTS